MSCVQDHSNQIQPLLYLGKLNIIEGSSCELRRQKCNSLFLRSDLKYTPVCICKPKSLPSFKSFLKSPCYSTPWTPPGNYPGSAAVHLLPRYPHLSGTMGSLGTVYVFCFLFLAWPTQWLQFLCSTKGHPCEHSWVFSLSFLLWCLLDTLYKML